MHSTLRTWTRLAVSACLLAGSPIAGLAAQAQGVPPGWVFQGTWHDGRWDGQWVPGGAPGMMPQGPMPQGPMPQGPGYGPVADRHTQHMIDRCRYDRVKHGHDRDCERFFDHHPEYAPGYAAQTGYGAPPMGPYGQMPYGAAPMGYMMVPVMQAPQAAPYTETKTVTTTYVTEHDTVRYHHVTRAKPHRDKRVYTGS
jgi:hypothetical protein